MAPSATATQSMSSKVKRPVPPGIQTNGINSSTSSPSPSMSAGRLPSASKVPPGSAASNGAVSSTSGPRSASRTRRDPPAQLLGRGQRNSSVGLKSGNMIGDSDGLQLSEPMPYVRSDEYILKKYRGNVPSLIIHLHPTHFRFDQQEGSFTYKSPMRIVIEHLRKRTIPHDLVEFMDVPFYEGCMIVQIHDHKSMAPSQEVSRSASGPGKTMPFSVHNYNTFLTPSPYGTQPPANPQGDGAASTDNEASTTKSAEQKDKENMPAPAVPGEDNRAKQSVQPKKPKISTVVLHPTPLSDHYEFAAKAVEAAVNNEGRRDSIAGPLSATVPPTPSTIVPPTPLTSMPPPAKRVKKSRLDIDTTTIYTAESQVTMAITPALELDPVGNASESAALLQRLAHPMHLQKPPAPKTRKRTVAEMAADEALAADTERFMLTMDERLSSSIAGVPGSNQVDGDGRAVGVAFEPRFEKFKLLENIKSSLEEKARVDKLRKEEADRKAAQDRERDRLKIDNEKREAERLRANNVLQQQQAAQRRQQQQQQDAQARAQMVAQGMQGMPTQLQGQHAHPQPNGMMPNGMQTQPQRFHQQQVSQAQVSSPIVRNGTPQNNSSPMNNNIANVPMQQSTSSMGGSPPRPGSVVQQNHSGMGAPTSHGMTAQRSQQSNAGTPRMPSATPNMQNTPLNRQVSQTPRLSQASPLQGQVSQVPQMPMMPNGQPMPMTQQQHFARMNPAAQAQAIAQANALRQQGGQAMGGMMNHPQFNQQMLQAQMIQQQRQQQGMNQAANFAAMNRPGGIPANMNQNFMNGNPGMQQAMSPQQQQQMNQFQMQQAIRAHQAQQQQQQAQQQQQPQMVLNQQQMYQQQVNRIAQMYYQKELPNFQARYPNGIPEEAERQLRGMSQQQAQAQVQSQFRRRQMQQQQLMQNNLNGMQNGMNM